MWRKRGQRGGNNGYIKTKEQPHALYVKRNVRQVKDLGGL